MDRDPSKLDHNNIPLKYAGKKSLNKLRVSRKIDAIDPPLRPYPGQLRDIKRGVIGAVYAEDLEREEALMRESLDMPAEISKEDLMQLPEFLKIDQSKLPLEIFDNLIKV